MYSIVKTGGKQYRVEEGQTLLIERLPVDEGAQVTLQPLLYVNGDEVFDGLLHAGTNAPSAKMPAVAIISLFIRVILPYSFAYATFWAVFAAS